MRTRLVLVTLTLTLILIPSQALALTYHQASHLTQATIQSMIRAEAHVEGYGPTQTAALVELARRESNWHATSRSSHGGFLGTFQLSRSMCMGHPWYHPTWNTRRAIRYIRYSSHHYGTPIRALAFWNTHHYY